MRRLKSSSDPVRLLEGKERREGRLLCVPALFVVPVELVLERNGSTDAIVLYLVAPQLTAG